MNGTDATLYVSMQLRAAMLVTRTTSAMWILSWDSSQMQRGPLMPCSRMLVLVVLHLLFQAHLEGLMPTTAIRYLVLPTAQALVQALLVFR